VSILVMFLCSISRDLQSSRVVLIDIPSRKRGILSTTRLESHSGVEATHRIPRRSLHLSILKHMSWALFPMLNILCSLMA